MSEAPPSLPEALAAVQVLSRLGVSDELVGRTVREWLARTDLGSPPSELNKPAALPVRAHEAPPLVTAQPQLQPQVGPPGRFEFVKVRFDDGTATNVALARELFDDLMRTYGNAKIVRERARELAKAAPRDAANRSAWVADALRVRASTELRPG